MYAANRLKCRRKVGGVRLVVCRHSTILVDPASHVEVVVDRPMFELSLEFLPAGNVPLGNDVTTLKDTSGPRVTGLPVRTAELCYKIRPELFQQALFSLSTATQVEYRHPTRSQHEGCELLRFTQAARRENACFCVD
jgi:hypothetical protein